MEKGFGKFLIFSFIVSMIILFLVFFFREYNYARYARCVRIKNDPVNYTPSVKCFEYVQEYCKNRTYDPDDYGKCLFGEFVEVGGIR